VCLIKTLRWQIPVKVTASGKASKRIDLVETLKADD
jgi:hypothetical protein